MKVVILTQDDPFYLPAVFERLVHVRGDDIGLVVVLPVSSGKETGAAAAWKYLRLYGLWGFMRQSGRYGWYRLADALGRALRLSGSYSVRSVLRRHRIPFESPENINSPAFLERLRLLKPDVILSVAATQIMGNGLISIPRLGTINIHGGELPRYRGLMPSFWVLANGEEYAAVTLHYATPALDDGDIIIQRKFKVEPEDTQDSLIRKSKAIGAEVILEGLDLLERGEAPRLPNDRRKATYFSFPTPEDVRRFRARGRKFF